MQKLRTALIGCGKVGQIHAAALRELPESDLVAVCDADNARATAFAERFGGRPFTDLAAMLQHSGAQVVVVCTPHPLHAEAVIASAEAGVHALVEKPLAASLLDCDAMLAASKRAGTQLGVISQRRFYEPVQRMKAAIDAGKIGRPVLGGRSPLVTGEDGRAVVAMFTAIYRSNRERRPIRFPVKAEE